MKWSGLTIACLIFGLWRLTWGEEELFFNVCRERNLFSSVPYIQWIYLRTAPF